MGLFRRLVGKLAAGSRRHKVVLYDSPLHGYPYVVYMLEHVCSLPHADGFNLAQLVDTSGSADVFSGNFDECNHICRLIREYGPDASVDSSATSMRAEVVPA